MMAPLAGHQTCTCRMRDTRLSEAEIMTLRLICNTSGGVAFGSSGRDRRGREAARAAKLVRLGLAKVGAFKTEATDTGRQLLDEVDS